MYLYRVTTIGNYRAYVVAETTTEAYEVFKRWLEEHSYGYYDARQLKEVEVIAEYGRMCDEYANLLIGRISELQVGSAFPTAQLRDN